ncbi:RNA polymerase sigma factor [Desulfamplus magnetovallimortis]|uniref:RNA polymerase sigma factor n=2 Tax=Desulfamplus magnetovallimortis TaxID=1246637 RepID=A0A1W1H9R8_9BACT|nr:RNA polymerase sigma factor [Desulfamplus magnetovallimortis]
MKSREAWREATIVEYAYLVKHIAASFARRLPSSVFFDELVSAGSMGLIDAVDKFDPEKHVTLKTYAQYRIRGAILDELRSMDKYSRSLRKKIQEIAAAQKSIEDSKGAPASDSEIADALGVGLDTYNEMVTQIHGSAVLSLDAYLKTQSNDNSSQTRFMATLKGEETPSDQFDREELKSVIAQSIGDLSEKEQLVVSLYYYEELTLKEIGEVLELTESRICQIHATILTKLKSRLKSYYNG